MAKDKDKERILKVAREKQRVNYKGTPIRLSADFSTEMLQARREWQDIFKVLKWKHLQLRILYPARLSFRIEGEIKNFSGTSLVAQWLRLCAPNAGGLGSIAGQGTRSHLHATTKSLHATTKEPACHRDSKPQLKEPTCCN